MSDNNLTKTELMAVRHIDAIATSLRKREQEINAFIQQLQTDNAALEKDQRETFAEIENRHDLPTDSIGVTHRVELIANGRAARIVPVNGTANQTSEQKPDADKTEDAQAAVN